MCVKKHFSSVSPFALKSMPYYLTDHGWLISLHSVSEPSKTNVGSVVKKKKIKKKRYLGQRPEKGFVRKQSPDHILQSCSKYVESRQLTWPHGADLVTKPWDSAEDLCRMTGFVASVRLKIWPARLWIAEEENEGNKRADRNKRREVPSTQPKPWQLLWFQQQQGPLLHGPLCPGLLVILTTNTYQTLMRLIKITTTNKQNLSSPSCEDMERSLPRTVCCSVSSVSASSLAECWNWSMAFQKSSWNPPPSGGPAREFIVRITPVPQHILEEYYHYYEYWCQIQYWCLI